MTEDDLRRFVVNLLASDPGALPKPVPPNPSTLLPNAHNAGDFPVWDVASQRWVNTNIPMMTRAAYNFTYNAVTADTNFRTYGPSAFTVLTDSSNFNAGTNSSFTIPTTGTYLVLGQAWHNSNTATFARWSWSHSPSGALWGPVGGLSISQGADSGHPSGLHFAVAANMAAGDNVRPGGFSQANVNPWQFSTTIIKLA